MEEISRRGHLNKTVLLVPTSEKVKIRRSRVAKFFKIAKIGESSDATNRIDELTTAITFFKKGVPELIEADTKYYEDVGRSLQKISQCVLVPKVITRKREMIG
jgi:hypothetical protein